jgi:hypothetical protein
MIIQIGMHLVIAPPPAKCLRLSAQPALTRVGPDADIANWADLLAERRLRYNSCADAADFRAGRGGRNPTAEHANESDGCYYVY